MKKAHEQKLVVKRLLSKGKRGLVYLGSFGKQACVVKKKKPESKTPKDMGNEGLWLKTFNKHNIGPQLYFYDAENVVMEYVQGIHLVTFLAKEKNKQLIRKVLKDILLQCFVMDTLGVNKYEMHRITKNVIVRTKNKKPILIDFERCKRVEEPKNVTQFCTFLLKTTLFDVLRKDVIALLKVYKHTMNKKNFDALVRLFFKDL